MDEGCSMPSENAEHDRGPARKPNLPLGLLGMLALIVVVESLVMGHDHDLTTLIAGNWRIEGQAPARVASRNEILCFGDSMVKFGIQPRVLQARVRKSAYNFALYCGAAPSSYFLLRRSIDSGARPAAVIVDFQPELLMCDSMSILSRVYPEMLSFAETVELCRDARDTNRLAEFLIAKALPTARKRHEIRASVLAVINGESVSIKEKLLAARRNWQINKGAEVLPVNPYFQGVVPDSGAYPAMFWTPWKANRLNDLYLGRFLELAASRDLPVFWVIQPNVNEVDVRREKLGYNAQYEAYVRAYLEKYPNLVVIDGRHVNYPHQVFTDPVHLDRHGATAYSLGVADVLRSRLVDHQPGPRWVALPDHRFEADAIGLEDNAQSSLALGSERARNRR
jgi:hypothetical protein